MRKTCLDMVYQMAKTDDRIFFIGSDLGFGTLKNFKEEMSDRFYMEGVSEMNVVGMAAGLALEGKIVYANTIATFLTRRCFEQNVLDLGLHNVNVRLIGNGGGLVYAPLGPTHLAIDDIAIMRAIPNMTVVAVADAEEMTRFMPQSVNHRGPMYIRLAKGHDPIVTTPDMGFEIGKAVCVQEGEDALVVTTGVTLGLARKAAQTLEEQGLKITILHMPTIKPLDSDALRRYAARVPLVITAEEHTVIGGLGSAVAEEILEAGLGNRQFKRIGLRDVFPEDYGSQESLMQRYGITSEAVVETVAAAQNKQHVKL